MRTCRRPGQWARRAIAAVAQQIQLDRLSLQRQKVPLRVRALRRAHIQPRAEHGGRNLSREAEGRTGPSQSLLFGLVYCAIVLVFLFHYKLRYEGKKSA